MRIFSKGTLKNFWEGHADSEEALKTWYEEVNDAIWKTPFDVKMVYPKASIVANNRVVFNICGNKYGLVVKFNYEKEWAFIRFIGKHSEYDEIDVTII
jgi:mRNA interferase HigB